MYKNDEKPKILVITLYSGENEIGLNRESVISQNAGEISHVIIENLPNVEAHEKLYTLIMNGRDDYDLYIKLDADMVFHDENSIANIIAYFQQTPELDHLFAPVYDHLSKSYSKGFHVFSKRVQWSLPLNKLFPDPHPTIRGKIISVSNLNTPIINHMPNPSAEQAFMFGFHRALKVVQNGQNVKSWNAASVQLDLMTKVWKAFNDDRDTLRASALLGFVYGVNSNSGTMEKKVVESARELIGPKSNLAFDAAKTAVEKYFSPRFASYWMIRLRNVSFRRLGEVLRDPQRILNKLAKFTQRL